MLRCWRVVSRFCPPAVYAETFEEAACILGESVMEEDLTYQDKADHERAVDMAREGK